MKKLLTVMLCLVLAMSVVGCGKKDEEKKNDTNVQVQSAGQENKSDKTEDAAAEEEQTAAEADNAVDTQAEEAPVIESSEELEDVVNEFNSTEDPERKEELRQQLEALFEQAEQATAE